MMLLQQPDENIAWMAPYAYIIVMLGFSFVLFRVFENWYANSYNKPLFRHYMVYKKLSRSQAKIIEDDFSFYKKLSDKHKRQFQHRVSTFLSEKKFVGREGLEVTERMKVLIASAGCMLSFGRKNYKYNLIEFILIYPKEFYSAVNNHYHKGEFNPREKALVLSWKDFEEGYKITDNNLNLGIHEFMHAMQLESRQSKDIDAMRFSKQFQNILMQLTDQELKNKLDETRYFKTYAFSNQYEFMAILAEYFIESPMDFKTHFPTLYKHTQKLLNFTFAGY
jgi:Mlc titration factor MtfA (ptsG expression regulator)